MKLFAGTSGYSYKEWKGSFYPDDLPAKGMLGYYAQQLPAVEINNTFYRMPRAEVVEAWAAQVPDAFRFVIKASRRITHLKRLKDVHEETGYLLDTLQSLGRHLGMVLFQLPPNLKCDMDRLQAFLDILPERATAAFEFRHESWSDPAVTDLLAQRDLPVVVSDTDEAPITDITANATRGYLRLRRAAYDDDELRTWLERIRRTGWGEAYVFFKHEDEATGPALARRFLELEQDPSADL